MQKRLSTIRVIVTEVGEFKPTPELDAILDEARIRKDGQPDLRTRAGKRWPKAFREFSDSKLKEYLSA
jgi:hypothetical protein